jgi:hypothetical protein
MRAEQPPRTLKELLMGIFSSLFATAVPVTQEMQNARALRQAYDDGVRSARKGIHHLGIDGYDYETLTYNCYYADYNTDEFLAAYAAGFNSVVTAAENNNRANQDVRVAQALRQAYRDGEASARKGIHHLGIDGYDYETLTYNCYYANYNTKKFRAAYAEGFDSVVIAAGHKVP